MVLPLSAPLHLDNLLDLDSLMSFQLLIYFKKVFLISFYAFCKLFIGLFFIFFSLACIVFLHLIC